MLKCLQRGDWMMVLKPTNQAGKQATNEHSRKQAKNRPTNQESKQEISQLAKEASKKPFNLTSKSEANQP